MEHMTTSLTAAKDALGLSKQIVKGRKEQLRLVLLVDPQLSASLIQKIKEEFVPQTPWLYLHVATLEHMAQTPCLVNPDADACICICKNRSSCAHIVQAWESIAVPVRAFVPGLSASKLFSDIATWLIASVDASKLLSLSSALSWVRPAYASRETRSCARANALIGTIDIVHGADFPLMFLREVKMLASIAGSYGYGLGESRIADYLALAVAALVAKSTAEQLTTRLSLPASLLRAATAYVSTYGMGVLVGLRFQHASTVDMLLSTLAAFSKDALCSASGYISHLAGRSLRVDHGAHYYIES